MAFNSSRLERPNIDRPGFIPDLPKDPTDSDAWLDWTRELLGNISDEVPTFEDVQDYLEDIKNIVPVEYIGDVISEIYDTIEEEIDPAQYIPDAVIDELNDMDIAKGISELAAFGYDMIVDGKYIDPWADKVLDYADFNVVVPRVGKTKVKGTKKDDLMSGHWESHKYEGKGGNDRIFTWYGKDTLNGGSGKDHLYVDGDDCTMSGGSGKDYFYLDGGGTALIKDYENKDVIRVDGYKKGNINIKHKKGDSLIKAGKHTLAKVLDTKLSKKDLQYSGGSNNREIDFSGDDASLTDLIISDV